MRTENNAAPSSSVLKSNAALTLRGARVYARSVSAALQSPFESDASVHDVT